VYEIKKWKRGRNKGKKREQREFNSKILARMQCCLWLELFTNGEVRWINCWINADNLLQQCSYCTKRVPQHRRQVRNNFPFLAVTNDATSFRTKHNSLTFYTPISKIHVIILINQHFINRNFSVCMVILPFKCFEADGRETR